MNNKEQLKYFIAGQRFMRSMLGKLDKVIMQEIYKLFKERNK